MLKRLVSVLLVLVMLCCTVSAYAAKAKVDAPDFCSAWTYATWIELYWGYVADSTGYEIYRSVNNGSWKKIKTMDGTWDNGFNDFDVKAGSTYKYKVAAVKGKQKSEFVECDPVIFVPGVRLMHASIDNNVLTLKWKKISGISEYFLMIDETNEKGEFVSEVCCKRLNKKTTSYVFKKCKPGCRYHIGLSSIWVHNGAEVWGSGVYMDLFNY